MMEDSELMHNSLCHSLSSFYNESRSAIDSALFSISGVGLLDDLINTALHGFLTFFVVEHLERQLYIISCTL